MVRKIMLKLGSASLVLAAIPYSANAATLFTDRTSFEAATGALTTEDFNGAPTSSTSTSRTFGDVTFSCNGTVFCPAFFGTRSLATGSQSVFFATPDLATFSFASPVSSFGLDIFDVGTSGATDFSVSVDGTPYLLKSNFSGPSFNSFFFGISGGSFSNLTFSGTANGDGIDFDNLAFGSVAAVPEPATWAMMLLGFGFVGGAMRSAKRRQKLTVSYA